jgi:hypothetical protein
LRSWLSDRTIQETIRSEGLPGHDQELPAEQSPKREEWQIHSRGQSIRALTLTLFSAVWIYTALLTLPFSYWMPAIGLDDSHIFGTNYLPNAGFRYGSDLVFTFGPWGYLIYPENIGNHIAVANLFRAAIWLLLLVHLILLYRIGMRGFWKSLLLMVAIIASRNMLLGSFDYYMIAVLLVIILYLIERPESWLGYASIIVISGVLAMTKFTAYIISSGAVVLLLAVRSGWPPKLLHLKDRAVPFAVLLALPIAFLLHNHSIRALFDYTYGALELSSGYNEAMSLPTGPSDLFYSVFLGLLFLGGVIYAAIKRSLSWTAAPILLILYWINFKHGLVRSDDHPPFAYCFEIILAAFLICLLRGRSVLISSYVITFPWFAILALSATNVHWKEVWSDPFWSSASVRQSTADLINWKTTAARIDDEAKKIDEFQQLPDAFRSLLTDSTATVFPWELAYARSGHFKLRPLYTMQAYSAYTEYLDRKTAEHVRINRDRSEYVLFEWKEIDDRHPLLDVPQTWMALVDNYQIKEVAADKLLLKRRESPFTHKQQTALKKIPLPIGKWMDLPGTKTELWARIHITYSFFGGLRKTLYKADAIYLAVMASNHLTARFRVVPSVLSYQFPLTALPVNFNSLVNILQSQRVEVPIVRIRLETDYPAEYREPSLELLEETETRLTFREVSEESVSERSFEDQFRLASPAAIPRMAAGNIDLINGVDYNRKSLPDESHPLPVQTKSGLVVAGWLADRPEGSSFDAVYAVVNGRLVPATILPRPDVAAYLKNPALARCGYQVRFVEEDFRKGIQRIDVIGVINKEHAPYRFPNAIYVGLR